MSGWVNWSHFFLNYKLIKLPIMEGFQFLRCLKKHFVGLLKFVVSKFSKLTNLIKKYTLKFKNITFTILIVISSIEAKLY